MQIKQTEFIMSAAKSDNFYESPFPEVAFAGRSNVGKSSLINALCNNKKLAKTSAAPGRTRLINFFLINKNFLLVDLPGYGYAKAPKVEQAKWSALLEDYLKLSKNLKCVYVLLDIRRTPSEKDILMTKFLYFYNIPLVFIATKADKISKNEIFKNVQTIANTLGVTKNDIIISSADKKQGVSEILSDIEKRITI